MFIVVTSVVTRIRHSLARSRGIRAGPALPASPRSSSPVAALFLKAAVHGDERRAPLAVGLAPLAGADAPLALVLAQVVAEPFKDAQPLLVAATPGVAHRDGKRLAQRADAHRRGPVEGSERAAVPRDELADELDAVRAVLLGGAGTVEPDADAGERPGILGENRCQLGGAPRAPILGRHVRHLPPGGRAELPGRLAARSASARSRPQGPASAESRPSS